MVKGGANIYYNSGNVGIGTATIQSSYKLQVEGNAWVKDQLVFSSSYRGGGGTDYACNKIVFYEGTNTPTTTGSFGFGVSIGQLDYFSNNAHVFFTGTAGGTTYGTERMRITSGGNVGIGTNTVNNILQVGSGGRLRIANSSSDYTCIGSNDIDNTDNSRLIIVGYTYGSGESGNIKYYATSTGSHRFITGGTTERMVITSTGNVLINKPNSAGVRLEVITTYDDVNSSLRIDAAGGNDHYSLNIWAFVQGAGMVGWRFRVKSVVGGDNTAIQISNTGSVYFPIGSSSASDSRIKKDIEDINDESALNKLLLIQPTTYNYIDVERNKGFGKVYGFIAQQIREVIPEAITIIVKEIIPNIYKRCLINNKREVYHGIPLDTPIDTSVKIDDTLYKIKEIYEDYFVIDNDIDTYDAFVFGYSVNDFHTLDKTYIFTLNVCATQELHRRIETQSVLLKSQDDRIKDLETKVERLINSMNA